jgi:hypothetical protein
MTTGLPSSSGSLLGRGYQQQQRLPSRLAIDGDRLPERNRPRLVAPVYHAERMEEDHDDTSAEEHRQPARGRSIFSTVDDGPSNESPGGLEDAPPQGDDMVDDAAGLDYSGEDHDLDGARGSMEDEQDRPLEDDLEDTRDTPGSPDAAQRHRTTRSPSVVADRASWQPIRKNGKITGYRPPQPCSRCQLEKESCFMSHLKSDSCRPCTSRGRRGCSIKVAIDQKKSSVVTDVDRTLGTVLDHFTRNVDRLSEIGAGSLRGSAGVSFRQALEKLRKDTSEDVEMLGRFVREEHALLTRQEIGGCCLVSRQPVGD